MPSVPKRDTGKQCRLDQRPKNAASGPGCKSALNPPVVYSTDRSKAVVPVLVLLFVALWFILRGDLFYLRRAPAYLFEVVFVKCVRIWRTSVFFQFYGVPSGVIYNYSPPPPPPPPLPTTTLTPTFLLLFKVTLLQQRTVLLVT